MSKSRFFGWQASIAAPVFSALLFIILVTPLGLQDGPSKAPSYEKAELSITPRAGVSFGIRSTANSEGLGVRPDSLSGGLVLFEQLKSSQVPQVQAAPRMAPSYSYRLSYLIPIFNSTYKGV